METALNSQISEYPQLCTQNGKVSYDPINDQFLFEGQPHADPDVVIKPSRLYPKKTPYLMTALRRAYNTALHAGDSELIDNQLLLDRTICTVRANGKRPTKLAVQVVAFKKNPYVWLKRYWYRRAQDYADDVADAPQPDPEKDGGEWVPCQGGLRFSYREEPLEDLEGYFNDVTKLISERAQANGVK